MEDGLGHGPTGWEGWLERHGPALVLFARQWSATAADAEDAMQDGFIRFWKSRGRARDAVPLLYACVRSAAMDAGRGGRRRARWERRAAEGRGEAMAAFESPADRAERDAAVGEALAGLPGDQREVVVMKMWGGLTFGQIAEALGIPPNTAASRYRYAMVRLEADLRKEVAGERRD